MQNNKKEEIQEPINTISTDNNLTESEEKTNNEPLKASDFDYSTSEPENNESIENNVEEEKKESSSSVIPEWGKKDPAAWGAYIERKTRKEIESKFKDKLQSLEEKVSHLSTPKNNTEFNELPEDNTQFYDPENPDLILDANTPEGQASLAEYALRKKREEHLQAKYQQEIAYKIQERKEKLKDRIENVIKKEPELEDILKDTVESCKHSSQQIIDFVVGMPNNQTDFLFYLARNKKEWHRIASLDPVSRQSEMLRHHGEFNYRNRVGNTSPPVQSLSRPSKTGSITTRPSNMAEAEALLRAKYNRRG